MLLALLELLVVREAVLLVLLLDLLLVRLELLLDFVPSQSWSLSVQVLPLLLEKF